LTGLGALAGGNPLALRFLDDTLLFKPRPNRAARLLAFSDSVALLDFLRPSASSGSIRKLNSFRRAIGFGLYKRRCFMFVNDLRNTPMREEYEPKRQDDEIQRAASTSCTRAGMSALIFSGLILALADFGPRKERRGVSKLFSIARPTESGCGRVDDRPVPSLFTGSRRDGTVYATHVSQLARCHVLDLGWQGYPAEV
jgi:hypothetical protein